MIDDRPDTMNDDDDNGDNACVLSSSDGFQKVTSRKTLKVKQKQEAEQQARTGRQFGRQRHGQEMPAVGQRRASVEVFFLTKALSQCAQCYVLPDVKNRLLFCVDII